MLRSTVEEGLLHLTADLRAADLRAIEGKARKPVQRKVQTSPLGTDHKQFPAVDDVVAILDRIAARTFIA